VPETILPDEGAGVRRDGARKGAREITSPTLDGDGFWSMAEENLAKNPSENDQISITAPPTVVEGLQEKLPDSRRTWFGGRLERRRVR
jgi:hypothetical protein